MDQERVQNANRKEDTSVPKLKLRRSAYTKTVP